MRRKNSKRFVQKRLNHLPQSIFFSLLIVCFCCCCFFYCVCLVSSIRIQWFLSCRGCFFCSLSCVILYLDFWFLIQSGSVSFSPDFMFNNPFCRAQQEFVHFVAVFLLSLSHSSSLIWLSFDKHLVSPNQIVWASGKSKAALICSLLSYTLLR